jgi:hypothetical protein
LGFLPVNCQFESTDSLTGPILFPVGHFKTLNILPHSGFWKFFFLEFWNFTIHLGLPPGPPTWATFQGKKKNTNMPGLHEPAMTGTPPHGATARLGAIKEKMGLSDVRTTRSVVSDSSPKHHIIDIRHTSVESNLKAEVLALFHNKNGPRMLPTLLLYDDRGLQLFEKVSPSTPRRARLTPRC